MELASTRKQRKMLERENEQWPKTLMEIPEDRCPANNRSDQVRIWRSRDFLVQEFPGIPPMVAARLSVCRTRLVSGRWEDGIGWDDLQAIKNECGYADFDAVEIYPAKVDTVDVTNMRHLWVLHGRVPFAWRRGAPSGR